MVQELIFPTASSVAVFLNGIHVDQAYGFNYKDSIPKVPIYGYNDYEYTKVARGKGIVQGLLVINFIFPGYLSAVLNRRQTAFVPKLYNYNIIKDSPSSSAQMGDNISRRLATELPPNISSDDRAARAEYISSLISKNPGHKAQVKKTLAKFFNQSSPQDTNLSSTPYFSVPNPLTIETTSNEGNIIDIYFSDPEYATWFVRFNHVEFTETSQQMSQAGAEGSSEPLYMLHQFIAKNVDIKQVSITQFGDN